MQFNEGVHMNVLEEVDHYVLFLLNNQDLLSRTTSQYEYVSTAINKTYYMPGLMLL